MMTKSEEILAICEDMSDEQLLDFAQLIADRARVIRQQKEETAWAKVVKAWKEYRQLCPTEEKWVEVEVECDECDWEGLNDVDIFELLDKIVN